MIKIKIAKRGRNRFGARKYATVPSHTEKNKKYVVAKCRKRAAKHYYYVCSCPYNFYTIIFTQEKLAFTSTILLGQKRKGVKNER